MMSKNLQHEKLGRGVCETVSFSVLKKKVPSVQYNIWCLKFEKKLLNFNIIAFIRIKATSAFNTLPASSFYVVHDEPYK